MITKSDYRPGDLVYAYRARNGEPGAQFIAIVLGWKSMTHLAVMELDEPVEGDWFEDWLWYADDLEDEYVLAKWCELIDRNEKREQEVTKWVRAQ